MEILVTNVIETMKLSKSKQVAGYIFACCIALGPSLPLLAGFAVQKLLAVSLCQQIRRRDVIGNTAAIGTSSEPYAEIWVGVDEGTIDAS